MFTTLAGSAVHETPNAVMRRYPGTDTALWRTEMAPGATGPSHIVNLEQVVVVLEGQLQIRSRSALTETGSGQVMPWRCPLGCSASWQTLTRRLS